MYFDYVKERQNVDNFQTDKGFILYKVNGEECFLAEVYVKPEFRGTSEIAKMIRSMCEIAESKGCNLLTANVHLSDSGSGRTIKAALKLDFFIAKADHNIIVIAKHLGAENG